MKKNTKAELKRKEDTIILSIIYVFLAWFSVSALVESVPYILSGLGFTIPATGEEINFVTSGASKFLLLILIFYIVTHVERNNLSSLGLTKISINGTIFHSTLLYTIITGTFFALLFMSVSLGINLGSGFKSVHTFVSSYAFWFFILASATSEEVLFRGFLIKRVAWLIKNDFVSLVLVSAFYGFLHLSSWGYIGLLGFGIWGFIIGVYFVYVKESLYPLMIAHFFSDLTIFTLIAWLV